MTAMITRTTTGNLAHQRALEAYRASRQYREPYYAARDSMHAAARYLADDVLDGRSDEWAREHYRTARAIYDEVVRRGAIGIDRSHADKTPRERFWTVGRER